MFVNFSQTVLYLTLYSALGWICEVLYCSIPARKLINRGFLKGPYCPIYGLGAFAIVEISFPFSRYPALVFFAALLSVTVLEYVTGWLMEVIFQIRWWDYSDNKFNIKGRICLKNSMIFGVMGLVTVYWLQPLAERIIHTIPGNTQRVLASLAIAVFFLDLVYTLNTLLKLTEKLKTIRLYVAELEKYHEEYAWFQSNDLLGSITRLRAICLEQNTDEKLADILHKLETILQKPGEKRLANAFPNLKPKGFGNAFERLREIWAQQVETYRESWKNRTWKAARHISRKAAASTMEAASSFARGLSFHKLLWVFVTASVLGYIVETLFCLATRGVIESRQGLVYGPFSQVYGFGAVLMVLLLTPLTKKNDRWLFMGSAVIGGAFEYLCSFLQETIFGSVSWEYSGKTISIGGRTSLTYMLFWGILGLVFMKGIYPTLSRLIERIPKRQGLFFSWIFIITISADMLLSAAAVYRWSQRLQDAPPANACEIFLDKNYPDERLEEIYPNMTMLHTQ